MMKTIKKAELINIFLLAFLIILTIASYWSGLNSSFLFDDIPNFQGIGQHSHLGGWRDFGLYLLQGDSGLLGRPISLASFYINDQTWQGMNPFDFKYTNLMIHLINGLLIFLLSSKITEKLNQPSKINQWLPICVTTIWLIHPMQVNTVLYAVQRMTELSSLFTLVGLLCYLHGRNLLEKKSHFYWVWLLFGTGFSTILAIFSKENGILIIVYILAIEYLLLRTKSHPPSKKLSLILFLFAWIPFFALTLMLFKWGWIDQSGRLFTTNERVITETRILWIYIDHILIPKFSGNSLLYDDIEISHSLIDPITTLISTVSLITLFLGAWILRKRFPILAFGVIWFLAGHLLESTTVALELYFEHRNYLPMFGILFTASYYIIKFTQYSLNLRSIITLFLIFYIGLMFLSTHNISQRWSDPAQLFASWLVDHPHSQRILEGLDVIIGDHISPTSRKGLLLELEKSSDNKTNSNSSYLALRNLKISCDKNIITQTELVETLSYLQKTSFIPPLPVGVANFIHTWVETQCGKLTALQILDFIEGLRAINQLQQGDMPQTLHYWQAEVQIQNDNFAEAMQHFDQAYALDKNIDLLLQQASYLMSAGLYAEADSKLANAEQDFCTNWRSCLTLKLRQPDVDNLRSALQDKLKQEKANNHAQAINYSTRQE